MQPGREGMNEPDEAEIRKIAVKALTRADIAIWLSVIAMVATILALWRGHP